MDFVKDGSPFGLLVTKQILRLASPVFRTMLAKDSPFLESFKEVRNKEGIQVLRFEDDDPYSMEIVLNVLHLQSHRVPLSIELDRLYDIAELCDKYNLSKSFEHWGDSWAKPFDESCDGSDMGRLLFIMTTFKVADQYPRITKYFVENASMNSGTLKCYDENDEEENDDILSGVSVALLGN